MVKPISPEQTIPIRHAVLRQGMAVEACVWDRDGDGGTFHLGGYIGGKLVGVCTFQKEPFPGRQEDCYRLRGMAVLPESRGSGVGALMLLTGEDRVRRLGFKELWCDARIGAVSFYEKNGWEVVSGRFDIPAAGPHFRMLKDLSKPFGCKAED